MALFPGELIPWIEQRFFTADGAPLIAGKVWSYQAGSSTPQATYTSADLLPGEEHTNPLILDSAGRPEDGPIYLLATGYKFVVMDADDVVQYTIDSVENVGAVFASQFGIVLSEGGKNVTSGYQVLVSDRLVTVDSTGGPAPAVVTLLPASNATQPITIKNAGTEIVNVTASGVDTIDANGTFYALPAATAFNMPTITMVSDGVASYWILSSYGL